MSVVAKKLKPQNFDYQIVLDKIPQGIMLLNEGGEIVYLNDDAAKIFDRAKTDLIGKLFGHSVLTNVKTEIEVIKKNNMLAIIELQISEFVWAEQVLQMVILLDVTEVKTQKALLEAIIDNIPMPLVVKDVRNSYKYMMWNNAAEKTFQLAKDVVIGNSDLDIWPDDFGKKIHNEDKKVVLSKRSFFTAEEIRQQKNNEIYLVNYKVPLYAHDDGEISHLLIISENITEKRKLQDEIKKEQMIAINASKMATLGEMAGGIAHEINNPLAIISGLAQQLIRMINRDQLEKKSLLTKIYKIDETTSRIYKIITGLKNISRDGERDEFKKEKLLDILISTLDFCSEKLKNNGIKLDLDVSEEIYIVCRATEVSQIFLNLINNAHDAICANEHRWINIKAQSHEHKVVIQIIDSGQGIDPVIVSKMMQPFYTTKPAGIGTGLGLSISKRIIEEHGGTIFYDASLGFTCFTIELPLSRA